MAGDALAGRAGEAPAGVAGAAVGARVRPAQREARERVVERRRLPGAVGVAGLALGRERARPVVGIARAVEVLAVAGDALPRRAREPRRVAAGAEKARVRAAQRERFRVRERAAERADLPGAGGDGMALRALPRQAQALVVGIGGG